MARYRLIDGLRGLAALLVLLSHVGFWTGADHLDLSGGLLARGDSGVAVFFAISAFLLLRPWLPGAPPQRIGGQPARCDRHPVLDSRSPEGQGHPAFETLEL